MKRAGIVCECNPFHDGHRRLIEKARNAGAELVLCVLSDPFVQRGEPAILDARRRAEALVRGGADAVVSLPFPYSAASAEFFAAAGVEILSRLGADSLWFGSECGSLSLLSAAADAVMGEAFSKEYAERTLERGRTAAFLDALAAVGIREEFSSNDLLGIAYLCAIRRSGSEMLPVTVRREGNAYRETALHPDRLPSATALRNALLAGESPQELRMLPAESALPLREAIAEGEALADWKHAERALLARLRLISPEEIDRIAELSGGLGRRILSAAERAKSLEELWRLCASKSYTDARVRRGILFALFGITEEMLRAPIPWVRLLAANEAGCAYLASQRREGQMAVVTRAVDIPEGEEARRAAALEARAYALWSLCLPNAATAGDFLRRPPRILK